MNARSIYVMDARTGTELYAKQPDEFISNEVLLPMLIAMVVLDEKNPDDNLLITQEAQQTSTNITAASGETGLRSGERLSIGQLLSALLLANSQDAVVALAEVFPDDAAFVTALQDKAVALDLDKTLIASYMADVTTATGHTTVRDLGRTIRGFLDYPYLVELAGASSVTFIPNNMVPHPRVIANINQQLDPASAVHREDLLFGFLAEASAESPLENSYGGIAESAEGRFIVTLSGTDTAEAHYQHSAALYDWAFANFQSFRLIQAGEVISSLPLPDGTELDLVAETDIFNLTDAAALKPEFSINYIPGNIQAGTIAKDQLMGIAEVVIQGKVIASVNLLAAQAADLSDPADTAGESVSSQLLFWAMVIGFILVVLGTIVLAIRTLNLMKRSRKRQAQLRAKRRAMLIKQREADSAREKQQVINRSNF